MLKAPTSDSSEAPQNLCPECYLSVSGEEHHKCTPAVLPSIEMTDSDGGKSDEQQAAHVVRQKLVSEASTSSGKQYGTLTLATGGPPLHLEVKRPKNFCFYSQNNE